MHQAYSLPGAVNTPPTNNPLAQRHCWEQPPPRSARDSAPATRTIALSLTSPTEFPSLTQRHEPAQPPAGATGELLQWVEWKAAQKLGHSSQQVKLLMQHALRDEDLVAGPAARHSLPGRILVAHTRRTESPASAAHGAQVEPGKPRSLQTVAHENIQSFIRGQLDKLHARFRRSTRSRRQGAAQRSVPGVDRGRRRLDPECLVHMAVVNSSGKCCNPNMQIALSSV
ncbi:hypothetical protein CYMTET_15108 [Cymbomonas tetramitiformis]|uniref:Uncharacterized protein n=1 Tax=Cymbomonas tetramitiformis TaxID=36881 RepID=A0AAE0GF73_9CHLO|nr:hypothetical protein CYMTET_15108 [Cymbomonas tetramitiformis]